MTRPKQKISNVCVLQVKPFFLPVDIQHVHCRYRFFILEIQALFVRERKEMKQDGTAFKPPTKNKNNVRIYDKEEELNKTTPGQKNSHQYVQTRRTGK